MLHNVRRVIAFFRRNRLDTELADEIRQHLELRRATLVDSGLSPADADREARRQFGNVTAIRERSRDEWGSATAVAVLQDLRFGVGLILRNPGLSTVVVLTIARVMVTQLYGVSRTDVVAFSCGAVFVMVCAAVSAWLPARRAATIDPVLALRSE